MLAYKIFLYYPNSYCFREIWTCESVGTNKPVVVSSHTRCCTGKAIVTHNALAIIMYISKCHPFCVSLFWGVGGYLGVLEMCDHGRLGGLDMRSVKTGSQCFIS